MLLYFLICFVIPSYRTFKNTGVNPITFSKKDNTHDLIGFYMKSVMFLILLSAFETENFLNLKLDKFFTNELIQNIGTVLMLISFFWIVIAQFQMGNSWRIGIDENNKTELKRIGIFKLSRNPIFGGMIFSQLGFYLFHSTNLNLIILVVTYLLISIQVRLEEDFLTKQHGSEYLDFKKSVPRWLLF
jgi:protein-S-isoprenylcysteine O-methyltransferase Ste14